MMALGQESVAKVLPLCIRCCDDARSRCHHVGFFFRLAVSSAWRLPSFQHDDAQTRSPTLELTKLTPISLSSLTLVRRVTLRNVRCSACHWWR